MSRGKWAHSFSRSWVAAFFLGKHWVFIKWSVRYTALRTSTVKTSLGKSSADKDFVGDEQGVGALFVSVSMPICSCHEPYYPRLPLWQSLATSLASFCLSMNFEQSLNDVFATGEIGTLSRLSWCILCDADQASVIFSDATKPKTYTSNIAPRKRYHINQKKKKKQI